MPCIGITTGLGFSMLRIARIFVTMPWNLTNIVRISNNLAWSNAFGLSKKVKIVWHFNILIDLDDFIDLTLILMSLATHYLHMQKNVFIIPTHLNIIFSLCFFPCPTFSVEVDIGFCLNFISWGIGTICEILVLLKIRF